MAELVEKRNEYILSNTTWILRWINREEFVDYDKSRLNEKKNDIVLLLIWCNSYKNIKKCIAYLEQESNQNFDIIIVDNSTKNEEIKLIHDIWSNSKISVIKTKDNIWWSGWYSIWMEYIISKWYESLICFEDDVIPIDKDIISTTIDLLKNHDIVGNVVNWEDVFWMFHLRWYSVKLLSKKLWVVDPRFFLLRDDADFRYRCVKLWVWKLRKNTQKKCFHPLSKKDRAWVMCLHTRNQLFYVQKYPTIMLHFGYMLVNTFINILFGFSYYFITKKSEYINAVFYWIYSYLFQKIWINSNKKVLQKFINGSAEKPKNITELVLDKKEIDELLKNKYNLYQRLTWNIKLYNELVTSHNYSDRKNWVVTIWHISWRFAMRYQTIFCIDEYNYEEKKYYISIIENKLKYRYLKMLLSLIFTGIVIIPIIVAIMIKILIKNIHKIINYKTIDK